MFFKKMHGCGNDFIVLNALEKNINLSQEQISFLCHRQIGIGADSILIVMPSKKADFYMKIYNSDGTEAEMCGNGIRCITKFVKEESIFNKDTFLIETKAGIKKTSIFYDDIKVEMGKAIFLENPIKEYNLTCVDVGNPHAVMIVEKVDTFDVCTVGKIIENHSMFPNKTNVEFVEIKNRDSVKVRVWERGCGETFACGTGSCAVVSALNKLNFVNKNVNVELRGGILKIELIDNNIFMTGNAISVFDGAIELIC
jgi:diaminopimelate epimerase